MRWSAKWFGGRCLSGAEHPRVLDEYVRAAG